MRNYCVLHGGGCTVRSFGVCVIVSLIAIVSHLTGATFTVTTTTPDLNVIGTLRWAMNSANFAIGPDTIVFNIPGTGPQVIMPDSQLPILVDQAGVFIDGLTQTGASAGLNPPTTATLMVVIDGINAGAVHGIWIMSSNNTVQGLVVQRFQQDGIRVQARPDTSQFNYIYCNFVGTDQTGTFVQGNGMNLQGLWGGIYIMCPPPPEPSGYAYYNTVDRNLSSGNYAEGIGIASCPPADVAYNNVFDNYVGTDITGTVDLGNIHDGVYIGEGAHDNVVDGNLISGNDFEGVCIVGYHAAIQPFTYANTVGNNIIGLDINLLPLGNTRDGVSIGIYGTSQEGYAIDNIVVMNTIAHNGRNGVLVWEHGSNPINADRNWITQNSTYSNTMLGIDLGDNNVTANDPADPDVGANEEVNFPVIASAVYSGGQTTISGTVDIDTDPTQATVELFRVSTDPSGYGEGQTYLGFAMPDAAGNWSVIVPGLIAGDTVTATTTDVNFNTSEFAQNFVVVTGIEEHKSALIPQVFELGQNYPNPFSNSTAIDFAVPRGVDVNLAICDVVGRTIKVLADGLCSPAYYTVHWDGKDSQGRLVSPGVYVYTLIAGEHRAMGKMIITR